MDVCVQISELGIYPAVDPLDSTSRMLSPSILGLEHYECARGVQKLLQDYKNLQVSTHTLEGRPPLNFHPYSLVTSPPPTAPGVRAAHTRSLSLSKQGGSPLSVPNKGVVCCTDRIVGGPATFTESEGIWGIGSATFYWMRGVLGVSRTSSPFWVWMSWAKTTSWWWHAPERSNGSWASPSTWRRCSRDPLGSTCTSRRACRASR